VLHYYTTLNTRTGILLNYVYMLQKYVLNYNITLTLLVLSAGIGIVSSMYNYLITSIPIVYAICIIVTYYTGVVLNMENITSMYYRKQIRIKEKKYKFDNNAIDTNDYSNSYNYSYINSYVNKHVNDNINRYINIYSYINSYANRYINIYNNRYGNRYSNILYIIYIYILYIIYNIIYIYNIYVNIIYNIIYYIYVNSYVINNNTVSSKSKRETETKFSKYTDNIHEYTYKMSTCTSNITKYVQDNNIDKNTNNGKDNYTEYVQDNYIDSSISNSNNNSISNSSSNATGNYINNSAGNKSVQNNNTDTGNIQNSTNEHKNSTDTYNDIDNKSTFELYVYIENGITKYAFTKPPEYVEIPCTEKFITLTGKVHVGQKLYYNNVLYMVTAVRGKHIRIRPVNCGKIPITIAQTIKGEQGLNAYITKMLNCNCVQVRIENTDIFIELENPPVFVAGRSGVTDLYATLQQIVTLLRQKYNVYVLYKYNKIYTQEQQTTNSTDNVVI